jgi:hypothetical protein
MKTILVWYLVSVGGYGADQIKWSPPMPTQAECERVQKAVQETRVSGLVRSRCIQMHEVVK